MHLDPALRAILWMHLNPALRAIFVDEFRPSFEGHSFVDAFKNTEGTQGCYDQFQPRLADSAFAR